jgi:hypothetical protein
MRLPVALAATASLVAAFASAQNASPPATPLPEATVAPSGANPTPTPSAAARGAAPVPTAPPQRLSDPPVISIVSLPSENPFASTVDSPALPPVKPVAAKATTTAAMLVAIRVDPKGKTVTARRVRDPIPSVSAEAQKSFARWTFEPGRKAGQPVDSWASVRLDLSVEVDSPKFEQITLTAITPTTPVAAPFAWGSDSAFLDAWTAPSAPEGSVSNEQLDTPPVPKKTPWSADSYKGPFSMRLWIQINAAGKVDKAISIQASDPLLIGYFRRVIDGWLFRPARAGNAAAASWNELALSGQISYSAEIKQIASLRRSL